MQLMNRYLANEDDPEDSAFKQLSLQQSSASKATITANNFNPKLLYEASGSTNQVDSGKPRVLYDMPKNMSRSITGISGLSGSNIAGMVPASPKGYGIVNNKDDGP